MKTAVFSAVNLTFFVVLVGLCSWLALRRAPEADLPGAVAALDGRLRRLETEMARLPRPAEAPATPVKPDGQAAEDPDAVDEKPDKETLASLRAEVDTLAQRVAGLESDPIERAFSYVDSQSDELRRRGAKSLAKVARFDAEAKLAIHSLLRDPEARVRLQAVKALGKIGDKESAPQLAELLASDTDASVRREAADILGQLKASAGAASLVKALSDSNADVQGEAIASLGEIGAREAVPDLRALYDGDPGPHRLRLILALKTLGDDAPFRAEVDRLSHIALGGAEEKARIGAIEDLGRIARRESSAVFARALEDPSPIVRQRAGRFAGVRPPAGGAQ